jgi:glucose/mannose-6-phosphate isomerase
MKNLDNLEFIKKIDSGRVAESIDLFVAQGRQILKDFKNFKKIKNFGTIERIVVNGMGGSNLGARILSSVLKDSLPIPLLIEPGYAAPKYADKKTLYIASSYSGATEEVLFAYQQAKKQGAKIMAITGDGQSPLAKIIKRDKITGLIFAPKNNPSGQPRLGVGYLLFGILTLLEAAGVLKFSQKEKESWLDFLEKNNKKFLPKVPAAKNIAKKIAGLISGREAVLAAGEFLEGSVHFFRNHLYECGKNFGNYFILPEMNHYALESLSFPKSNSDNLIFIFFNSRLYHPRVQKRCRLTRAVVEKNKVPACEFVLSGKTKMLQALELMQLGAWASFYTAVANKTNPAAIFWVDWFKERMK